MKDPSPHQRHPMAGLLPLLRPLETALKLIVAAFLFFIMVLSLLDVLGRELVQAPVPAAFELTEMAMGVIIFSALPLLCARGQHVTVDLLEGLYRGRIRHVRNVLVALFSATVLGIIAWRLFEQATRYADGGEVTMILSFPLAPIVHVLAVLTVVSCVATLGRSVYLAFEGSPSERSAPGTS